MLVEIQKGMYGLLQAGRIANDRLTAFFSPHGYHPVPITPGLWRHTTRDITFTLVADDFGIKYSSIADAHHLLSTLQQLYKISTDWTGTLYCGMTLLWDYQQRTVDLSMPGYIQRALARFQHPPPTRPQHAPHAWTKPQYGARTQYAAPLDHTPALDVSNKVRLQEVLGTLLYYGRAIDYTILPAIITLATQQATPTQQTLQGITRLLNYCATLPNATLRFITSDMVLHIDSDASYLSEPKAKSRSAGYHYLSDSPCDPKSPPDPHAPPPTPNGAVHIHCQILKKVVSSATEAELGALFHNGKDACPLRHALIELGHSQPPTPLQTDNNTSSGIANDNIKQKRSKAMDMRFYWIRDRVRQGQFIVYWRPGKGNRADYFSKHHPPAHHQGMRPSILHDPDNPNKNYFASLSDNDETDDSKIDPLVGGCADPPGPASGFPRVGTPSHHTLRDNHS